MSLQEFLDKKNLTYKDLSDEIGASQSNVRFWALRVTTPGLFYAMKVNEYTRGKVAYRDMLSLVDRDKYEENKNKRN